ncbi:MAG: NAD-dependent epimerase/dehydratase family protein [Terracidiphilus sp.]
MSEATHSNVERSSGMHGGARKLRVALLGAGYIAGWHAKCLASVGGVELVAVCDKSRGRAETLAASCGAPHVYASLEEMLAAEALDAVHLLVPPDLHFDAAKTAIEAGVSVFLEKPMCDRAERCEDLVQLAAERHVSLGVGHNFLFSRPWEQLRRDVRSGVLGRIDQITITWNRFLPQSSLGPFDIWMLRDPRNIVLETGSHLVAHMLDLIGEPDTMDARASNPIALPTGRSFYRRWQMDAVKGAAAIHLRASFVPGFAEFNIHLRGTFAAATADIERNTYTVERYRAADPDFENYAMLAAHAKQLKKQARGTLARYVLSKLHLEKRATPFGESIARALDAFYAGLKNGGSTKLDERISGEFGARVIRICERIGACAKLPAESLRPWAEAGSSSSEASSGAKAEILVLGGTGFIGKELLRQLATAGRRVRVLVRSEASLPEELRARLDCRVGNLLDREALLGAMQGVDCVVHLARARVKTWADYQNFEIDATHLAGECALAAGVKRFVYTGTTDSYYAGRRGSTITEATGLDPRIERRNLYARAKAHSETALTAMHRERGLPLVIVRPGIVIGRGGSPFHWGVGMWWHDAVCQVWGASRNKLPLVLVEDVARGLIAAIDTPEIEGRSFNLVADACLSAEEYLDELDRAGGMRVARYATPILRFYLLDLFKWMVKVAVRHPERQLPSYRDWQSRTQQARFDCTAAKTVLGWNPVSERGELVRKGIEEPLREFFL